MKKITLKNLTHKGIDELTREQLKDILGGQHTESFTVTDCGVSCNAAGEECKTADCKDGICVYSGRFLLCS